MISEEGEKVPFKNSFNPNTAGGQVEKWLTEAGCARDGRRGLQALLRGVRHDQAHGVDDPVARTGCPLHRVPLLDLRN